MQGRKAKVPKGLNPEAPCQKPDLGVVKRGTGAGVPSWPLVEF